ncbi:cytochrome P450 [Aspergillus bertholletiae]|uniref:Cytochrome P450 n=1 Tax=Aspergillus bertholletiae TaxID=1226010 RepID=A0A5N7B553_9EURO|nr:cytochrome P450 [Aspergillus bertholletiae]
MHLESQLLAFIVGTLSYVGYFNRGEHHMYGTTYIQIHTVAFALLTALQYRLGAALEEAVKQTCLYDGIFLAGLFSSLLMYRAFLNPLNAFSGPWMARISSFYMTFRIQRMRMYKALQELHEKHGYFVRIGTQELSITHPSAVQQIFGADSVCQKSPWYDISRPQDSLLLRRTFAGHAELRSVWSQAFSVRAVKGYEQRIHSYRRKLIAELDAHAGQPVNINHWLGLYSWDVLSDLSFGHAFGMLDSKDHHWAMNVLDKGMSIVGPHLPMWFIRIMASIPGGNKDMKFMLKYCTEEMLRRWKTEPKVPDVMSALFAPYRKKEKVFDDKALNLLAGESHLLINAGSDTTRVTMACTLFVLAQQPDLAQRLRKALEPYVPQSPDELLMDDKIMNVDLLNGVVQEALRMYPPSPSHPTRVTPPEGTIIAGRFIPGGTQLIAPQYVIGRDERIFPRANEFIPERWYSLPQLVKDPNATAPFSLGPMNCVGKQLAMANVRVTLATLVMRYNLSFAPTRTDPAIVFEKGMHEHFSMQPGPLFLCLEERNKNK